MTNASAVRRAALLLAAAAAAGCAVGGTDEPPRLQDPPSIPATVEADGGVSFARTPESELGGLVRLVESCRRTAGEYRRAKPAGGGGDFLRIAALRQQYRRDWAALDAAVAEFPEVRDPALLARFEAEVRKPREALRTANADILEGR